MLTYLPHQLMQSIVIEKLPITVLRLDKMHTEINGNKYFKLKYLLRDAKQLNANCIVSYGGVWSNHIAAMAAACKLLQLPCKAFIRSDEKLMTPTLLKAIENGMQIEFCTRADYKTLKNIEGLQQNGNYHIPEGGASVLGVQGVSEILKFETANSFTHIIVAMGTGTTFAGIVNASKHKQTVIGLNALKGGFIQEKTIAPFLQKNNYEIWNDFHFGGFAKYDATLIQFIINSFEVYNLPTDIVYTAKVFFALQQKIKENYFDKSSNVLVVHTGGLQGNKSLTKETLGF